MTKYRSKLEERIADLFNELGVIFEYESTKVPYQISLITRLTLYFLVVVCLKPKGIGMQKTDARY